MSARTLVHQGWIGIRDALVPPVAVDAHCDIPCGIYDPHEAQLAALTVLRMGQLLAELKIPPDGAKPEEIEQYHAQVARYTGVKERHSDRAESEVVTLWADYFTPDHVKKFPELSDRVWAAMQAIGKARRSTAVADAEESLARIQEVAEIFWKSKDAKTVRVGSHSKAGHELLLPIA